MNMNTVSKTILNGLAIVIASGLSQVAMAQDAAKVIFKSGNAIVKHADGSEEALSKNSALTAGDTIETRKGRVQFKTVDGGKVSLQPETVFKFKRYAFSGKEDGSEYAITELVKGGLRTITGVIGHKNRDRYQLKTPVATIGIRGTEFSLTYTNKLVMSTLHGSVDVCNAGGCINAITGQSVVTNAFDAKPIYTPEKAQVGAAPASKTKRVFVKTRKLDQVASLDNIVEDVESDLNKPSKKPVFSDPEKQSQEETILSNRVAPETAPSVSSKVKDSVAVADAIATQETVDAADTAEAEALATANAAQAAADAASAAQAAADAASAAEAAAAQASADAAAQEAINASIAAQAAADAAIIAQAAADAAQAANSKDIIVASVNNSLVANLANEQSGQITIDNDGDLVSFDNGSYDLSTDPHYSYIDEHVALGITTGNINGNNSFMSYVMGQSTTESQLMSLASLGNVTYKILNYTNPTLVDMNTGDIRAYANDKVKGRLKVNFANLGYNYRLKVDQTANQGQWKHTLTGNGTLKNQASFTSNATVKSQYSGLFANIVNANAGNNNSGTVQGQLFGENAERAGLQYSVNVDGIASITGTGNQNNLSGSVVLGEE